jgi:small-conductance mechanosensitive channel
MQKIVTDILNEWNLHPYVWNLILLAASVLIGLLLSWTLSLFVKRQTGTEIRFRLGQSIVKHLSAPVSLLIPLFIFNNFIPLMQMAQAVKNRIATATEIALIISFAWLLIRLIRVLQDVVHDRVKIESKDNLRQRQIITQLIYIRRVATAIIIILTVGAVLLSFETMRKIGAGLLTSVGIGGIIIGFAAQRSLANLLAGFQIAFTQPIRIDDEVIVENEFGWIEELTLTYVVVRIWDNRRLVLPINYFIERPFQNWTRTTSDITGSFFLYVDYSMSIDWLRNEFMNIVKDNPMWDKKWAALVVTDLKPDVMELRCTMTTRKSGDSWELRCFVREELIRRISEEYPQSLPKTRAELLVGDAPRSYPGM